MFFIQLKKTYDIITSLNFLRKTSNGNRWLKQNVYVYVTQLMLFSGFKFCINTCLLTFISHSRQRKSIKIIFILQEKKIAKNISYALQALLVQFALIAL